MSFKSSVECGDHSFGKEPPDPPLGQGDSGLGVTGGMCPGMGQVLYPKPPRALTDWVTWGCSFGELDLR